MCVYFMVVVDVIKMLNWGDSIYLNKVKQLVSLSSFESLRGQHSTPRKLNQPTTLEKKPTKYKKMDKSQD